VTTIDNEKSSKRGRKSQRCRIPKSCRQPQRRFAAALAERVYKGYADQVLELIQQLAGPSGSITTGHIT
jgi:protein required for attachment to host cells